MVNDISKLTLSEANSELESIIKQFETGETDLESFLPQYKRAIALASMIKKRISMIKSEVKKISIDDEQSNNDN